MIFARDKSQMCNNLLQYAHVYAWGREHGRKVVSMRFSYKYQFFKICKTSLTSFPLYLFAKYMAALKLLPTASFKHEDCDYEALEQKMLKHSNIVVSGWFVRYYDLVIKYLDEIRDLFTLDPKYTQPVDEKFLKIEGISRVESRETRDESRETLDERRETRDSLPPLGRAGVGSSLRLGVHIRRGDYATWKDGRYFYDDEVYCKHIRRFRELHPEGTIHVYLSSNDPSVDEKRFSEITGIENIHNLRGTGPEDLYMLSQCDYIIGPPSTFSVVATMYRGTKYYRMDSRDEKVMTKDSFQDFNHWFRILV